MECSPASAEHSPISRSPDLVRIAISVPAIQVEQTIAIWELAGVYNSSVEYLPDEPIEEAWPGYDHRARDDDRVEVVAYLSADEWGTLEPRVRRAVDDLPGSEQMFHVKHLPNRDWRTAWHDYFDLVRIPGPRPVVVRPPHISYEPKPDELVVEIVPGLAFGTGQHQSTRLCLGLLAEQINGGERVLDVGTGSGILAVASAKMGADAVLATDIDPLAVDAAQQTVRQNQLSERVVVEENSVPRGQQFDLVVANLTADLLQYLATDLVEALRPGGALIASGLIHTKREEVAAAFESHGLHIAKTATEDDWVGLLLKMTEG